MSVPSKSTSGRRLQPGSPSEPRAPVQLRSGNHGLVNFEHEVPFEVGWGECVKCFRSNVEPGRTREKFFIFGQGLNPDHDAKRIRSNAHALPGNKILTERCEPLAQA